MTEVTEAEAAEPAGPRTAAGRPWRPDLAVGSAGFAAQAAVFGTLYTFGVVLEPIRDDLGTSTSIVALMPALSAFLLFFAGPLTGGLSDRSGAHTTLAAGGVLLAAGLWLASVAPSTFWVVGAYGILCGIAASLSYVPVVAFVAALPTRRAPALVGLVVSGVGVGAAVAAPILERAVTDVGWRAAFRGQGVAALAVMGLAALVIARHGRSAAGPIAAAPGGGRRSAFNGLRPLAARADFRRLYLALLLVCPAIYLGLIFLPGYATGRGLSGTQAALAASVLSIGSASGRLLLTGLAGRLDPVTVFRMSVGMIAGAHAVWFVAGASYPMLLVYAAVTGAGYGGTIGMAPTVLAHQVGRDGLGAALGGLYTAFGVGALGTGPAAGAVIDRWGHRPAIVAMGVMATAATVLVPTTPTTRHR